MSKRTLKTDDVDGFMNAFWDELMDTAKLYRCTVLLDIRPSVHKRRFVFHASATTPDENTVERLCGVAEVEWPSHKYTSVHAALYSLACKLNIAVQNDYRDRTGHYYSEAEQNSTLT